MFLLAGSVEPACFDALYFECAFCTSLEPCHISRLYVFRDWTANGSEKQ